MLLQIIDLLITGLKKKLYVKNSNHEIKPFLPQMYHMSSDFLFVPFLCDVIFSDIRRVQLRSDQDDVDDDPSFQSFV